MSKDETTKVSSDLLALCSEEKGEPKSKGHWIGRFTPEEYSSLCRVFGKDYVPPKDLKALLMAIANDKIGLFDKNRFDLYDPETHYVVPNSDK